jgi:putative DNA primase/helicase
MTRRWDTSAAEIAAALGGRRDGTGWRCRCPLHGGFSLTLRDGDAGRVLATCWGGCDRLDVLAELRRCGLLGRHGASYQPPGVTVPRRDPTARDTARTARVLAIWHESRPIAGTIAERYLLSRGIVLDGLSAEVRANLRYHSGCPRPRDDAGNSVPPLAAMLALVEHSERGPVAIHATYLRPDGSGKASIPKPKAMFGPVGGGAVRLGMPLAGEWLAISEGIETALAVAIACALPAWAALSAGGIRALVLPREATQVLICADYDTSGTGQRAAQDAAHRWLAEGPHVRIAVPPEPGTDMADALIADTAADATEGRYVA